MKLGVINSAACDDGGNIVYYTKACRTLGYFFTNEIYHSLKLMTPVMWHVQ